MKRKPNKDKSKSSKSPDSDANTKYSNEEISSAITLVSIMTNESGDQTDGSGIDVIKAVVENKDDISELEISSMETISSNETKEENEPKRKSNESTGKPVTIELQPKHYQNCYPSVSMTTTQPTIGGNYPMASVYGYYPMDSFGYPQHYPMQNMYAMQPTMGSMQTPMGSMQTPMGCRQCPYCMMTSPPPVVMGGHSSHAMPNNMNVTNSTSGVFGVHSIPTQMPQMISTQMPISSLYPYYQNGPKVTTASIPSNASQNT